jgi:hypothetical protein
LEIELAELHFSPGELSLVVIIIAVVALFLDCLISSIASQSSFISAFVSHPNNYYKAKEVTSFFLSFLILFNF